LVELTKTHPKFSNARGLGLLLGIDLPNKEQRDKILNKLKKNGLFDDAMWNTLYKSTTYA